MTNLRENRLANVLAVAPLIAGTVAANLSTGVDGSEQR